MNLHSGVFFYFFFFKYFILSFLYGMFHKTISLYKIKLLLKVPTPGTAEDKSADLVSYPCYKNIGQNNTFPHSV